MIVVLGISLFVFVVCLLSKAREWTDPREQRSVSRPAVPAPPPFQPNEDLIGRWGAMPSVVSSGPSGVPRGVPHGELGKALFEHLYAELASTPVEQRRSARWVMTPEWREEVIALVRSLGEAPAFGEEETLFGKPIETRPDGGVPHLEALARPPRYSGLPPAVEWLRDNGRGC